MTEMETQLVADNIRLVYYLAQKLGATEFVKQNKDDLASEGMVGLVKAARAFDPAKGIKFATFASRCINNEMLMFMRRNKKHEGDISLYAAVCGDAEGNELLLLDTLCADESNIERAERVADAVSDLRDLTVRLTGREKRILGYINAEMTQNIMAAELGISQSYVSRLVKKIRAKYKRVVERCAYG